MKQQPKSHYDPFLVSVWPYPLPKSEPLAFGRSRHESPPPEGVLWQDPFLLPVSNRADVWPRTSRGAPQGRAVGRLDRCFAYLRGVWSGFFNLSPNSIYSYDRPQRYHSEDPASECRKFPVLTRSFATRVRISRRRGPGFRAFRSFFDMRDPQEADCGSRNRCPAKKNCSGEHF